MIARIWTAETTQSHTSAYTNHFQNDVLPVVSAVDGYAGAMLLESKTGEKVDVMVVTLWQSLEAIRGFAGTDTDAAVVAEEAAKLFNRFDQRVRHYEVIVRDRMLR